MANEQTREMKVYVVVTHDNCFMGVYGTRKEACGNIHQAGARGFVSEETIEVAAEPQRDRPEFLSLLAAVEEQYQGRTYYEGEQLSAIEEAMLKCKEVKHGG